MFRTITEHIARHGAGIVQPIGASPTGGCQPTDWQYFGGHLLYIPRVHNVYWGTPPYPTASIEDWTRQIVEGGYLGDPNEGVGPGHFTGSTHLPDAAPTSTVADATIQNLLMQRIADGTLPAPDGGTIYQTFLPPGVTVVIEGQSSCQSLCAYHFALPDGVGFYSVIPDNSCYGCQGPTGKDSVYTAIMGHEIREANSDPIPGSGWYSNHCGEDADICAWQFSPYGSITVQPYWNGSTCTYGKPEGSVTPPAEHPYAKHFVTQWVGGGAVNAGQPLTLHISAQGPDNFSRSNDVLDAGFGAQGDLIHFTSSDPSATLPADYHMTYADHGNKDFVITFHKGGSQTVTLTSTLHADITGTSPVATVTATGSPVSHALALPLEAGGKHVVFQRVTVQFENVPTVHVTNSADLSMETLSPRHRVLPPQILILILETTKEVRKLSIPS